MNTVLISLGSNIDKDVNLPAAIARLRAQTGITVQAVSAVLETPAIGADRLPADQPSYYNAALRAETTLGLVELRQVLRQIEAELGRRRGADKYAPRTIDLDLVYYGDSLIVGGAGWLDDDVLHRAHVAIPLAEVAPTWVHPVAGVTLVEVAANLRVVA